MEHWKRIWTWSPRSDWPSHSVGRYVTTDQAFYSVATLRPIHRGPGRYVATELSRTSINGYDPNLCILVCSSMLAPMYRSHIISHSHRLELSLKLYDKNRGKFIFIDKNRNKRFESKDGPNRSKTWLETHLRFFKEKPIDTMAVYT